MPAGNGKEHRSEDQEDELVSGADERREEGELRGRAEDIAVHLLPAALVEDVILHSRRCEQRRGARALRTSSSSSSPSE
jgi:hypothetical protein